MVLVVVRRGPRLARGLAAARCADGGRPARPALGARSRRGRDDPRASTAHWTTRRTDSWRRLLPSARRRRRIAVRGAGREARGDRAHDVWSRGTRSCVRASRSLTCTTSSASSDSPEDERHPRAERVGAPELALERAAARVDLAADPAPAQVAREHQRRADGRVAERRDDGVDACSTAPWRRWR